jgi:outer membrane protein OmpA-like peptidoglycan-associated protein
MRLSVRMIATSVFAVLLMSTLLLHAGEAARPLAGNEKAVDPSVAEPAVWMLSDPMPGASMSAAMPYSRGRNIDTPRFELFLGYSYLRAVPTMADGNRLVWMHGGSASIAFNVNRYLGLVADVGDYTSSQVRFTGAYTSTIDVDNANQAALTYLFGPRLSFRQHSRITPFVQALFGGMHANEVTLSGCTANCMLLPNESTFAMTAGGGLDLRVRRHFAIRPIQAEYLMTRFKNYSTGTTATQNDMRLSSGIVFRFGGGERMPDLPPVEYACSVNPSTAFPGDTIAVSGTVMNLDPAKTAVYTWSADGGTVTGSSGSTAKIDTANLAPGAYTLKGHVSEGARASDNADCTAPYAVKAYEPPTVSCTANPATVISGDSSTITATGVSPQNLSLTYSYYATSGTVSGTGSTAILSTVGAALGPVTVTCNVVDSKSQTATGETSVTVAALPAAPKPVTIDVCTIHFARDVHRPSRVDNEAKACLDQVALNLQRNADATLAIVGNASNDEKDNTKIASERAVNTKAYLVSEKGIDSSRIALYTGSLNGMTVSNTLIPSGATFNTTGDTPIDESAVKMHPATSVQHNTK